MLKERFAVKRAVVCKKYALAIENKEREYTAAITTIDKKIAKIRAQMRLPEEQSRASTSASRPTTRSSQTRRTASRTGDFAATGRLTVEAPPPIPREGGIAEIEQMTRDGLTFGSPRSARAGALLREWFLK
jgi:hypothetical protein